MTYFHNINSLSELKKQFRELVKTNHPDKGGNTAVMQAINNEFEKLYNIWKNRKETADTTGYANDYEGATAKEYTQHVYEEYGWTGSRRDRYYTRKELKEIFAKWLKETYKGCTFSIRLSDYNSIIINLLKADFNPFAGEIKNIYSLRRFDIHDDPELNTRAKEIFSNIHSFCMSYNYDHSDLMSDYHDVGFYLDLNIGSSKTPFKVEVPKSRRASGACAAEFKYKEGPVHQAIKKVLGKQFFDKITLYRGLNKGEHIVLGENYCFRDGDICFRGLQYSGYTTQTKKIEKLLSVGIITECLGSYIKFVGYTPEVEQALAKEDREKEAAFKAWQEKQHTQKSQESENTQAEPEKEQQTNDNDNDKVITYINSLILLLDAVQDLMNEQHVTEEIQQEPEGIAKVLQLFPALVDAVGEILKASTQKTEATTESRKVIDNNTYNSVCTSVIRTGEYKAARHEIKQALRQYRFTIPQLKYLLFIIHNHSGISRDGGRDAA